MSANASRQEMLVAPVDSSAVTRLERGVVPREPRDLYDGERHFSDDRLLPGRWNREHDHSSVLRPNHQLFAIWCVTDRVGGRHWQLLMMQRGA